MNDKKTRDTASVGKGVEKRNAHSLLVGIPSDPATMGNSMEFPQQKLKVEPPYDSVITLLYIYSKNTKR